MQVWRHALGAGVLTLLTIALGMGAPAFMPKADATPEGEAIRLVHSWSLTPDARSLVFSWRDDIWLAPIVGGVPRQLTRHPANDRYPWVSPDGTQLAFVSSRSGSDQVYVMPMAGGAPEPVTVHSEGFILYGWYPDGQSLLVRARLDAEWRRADRFYRRSLDPLQPLEMVMDARGGSAWLDPSAKRISFVREGAPWFRKGYKGAQASQIWNCDLENGGFQKLTTGDHGERWPCGSPDGKTLYCSSQESGTFNLWRMRADGSQRKQLTKYEDDGVLYPRISADGSTIVFRHLFDLYRYDTAKGGAPERIELRHIGDVAKDQEERRKVKRATDVAFSEDGREVAFVAGGDIWVMDTELREPKQITDTAVHERNPLFSRDFQELYFVSDATGQPDIFRARREDTDKWWWQNDEFRIDRVTRDPAPETALRLVPETTQLAFVHGNGDLVLLDPESRERRTLLQGWDEPSFDFSPDGKWIVYSVQDADFNADVWIQKLDGDEAPFNLSQHPDHDMDPVWSPDGKRIAFLGRRWEEETDIYWVNLRLADEQEAKRDRALEKALAKMKKRGTPTPPAKTDPAPERPGTKPPAPLDSWAGSWNGRLSGGAPLPPDGLAFSLVIRELEEGTLVDFAVPGQMEVTDALLVLGEEEGSFTVTAATPLGEVTVKGTRTGERMTGSWTLGPDMEGAFELERAAAGDPDGKKDTPKKATDKKAAKAKKKVEIDFDGLETRVRRLSLPHFDESDLFWSHDGKKLAFWGQVKGKTGTWTVSFPDSLTPSTLTSSRGSGSRWIKEGNQITRLAAGQPQLLSSSGKATNLTFDVPQIRDRRDERAAAFVQAWRTMRDTYYDPAFGGHDWDKIRKKYEPAAAGCGSGAELEILVNLMLGELNGSHLSFRSMERRWSAPGWKAVTGHLGVQFDRSVEGDGLLVRHVHPSSPADRTRSRIEARERILAIDGHPVSTASNLVPLLTGMPRREIEIEVRGVDGEGRTVTLRPTTYGAIRGRMYAEWVTQQRAHAEEASEGRLGYLHIRGMNWPGFQKFELDLYKAGHGKDGLIIDVRENGGGFTADHVLTCLTQPVHAFTVPRGGSRGYPQGRMVYARWQKPITVLCNQNSFSNAEILAHAVQTLKRGPVVGVPTAGGVISTGGTTIMGLGSLRLPFRGWYLANSGEDMELNGCVPDHILWPLPDDAARGIDRQLDKAIEVLQAEVKKAAPLPGAKPASARK